jgi:ENTS family enterobactin (siderophore) exporter
VSYALGGVVFALVGAAAAISYDSITFFVAAGLLVMVARRYGSPKGDGPETATASRPNFWREFRDGLSFVRHNRLFVELSVFGLMANFFGAGFGAVIAPYVSDQIGGNSVSYGLVLSALALGGIVGAIGVGKLNFRSYVGKLLFGGVFLFGPLSVLAALATTVSEGIAVFFGIGVISGAVNLPLQVLVQTQVPREMLGRAATVLRALLGMATPVAALTFGALAGASSIVSVFFVSGVGLAAITAILYLPFKELRRASY